VYESNPTQTYWGTNYARLLSIKNKYDPARLMDCWQCGASSPCAMAIPEVDARYSWLGGPRERKVRVLPENPRATVRDAIIGERCRRHHFPWKAGVVRV
jgi:hypothetical protein